MKICVRPAFFAFLFAYTLLGGIKEYLVSFVAVFLHELSHLLIAHIAGEKDMRITLMPFGAYLTLSGQNTQNAAILLAGPLGSLTAVAVSLAFSWFFPEIYGFIKGFIGANLCIAFVNFLPAYPLDGGRLLREWIPTKWMRILTAAMTPLIAGASLVLFLIGKMRNPTLLTFGIFMFTYFASFVLSRPIVCLPSDPLFKIAVAKEDGSFRSVICKNGKTRIRLRGGDVAHLLLKYSADLSVGSALEKERQGAM